MCSKAFFPSLKKRRTNQCLLVIEIDEKLEFGTKIYLTFRIFFVKLSYFSFSHFTRKVSPHWRKNAMTRTEVV
uniref:Uncharacterized protein n=1 Tax=Anopheles atroparvus TaxID=41427 RepID=A0AAG5D4E5_ANOAO